MPFLFRWYPVSPHILEVNFERFYLILPAFARLFVWRIDLYLQPETQWAPGGLSGSCWQTWQREGKCSSQTPHTLIDTRGWPVAKERPRWQICAHTCAQDVAKVRPFWAHTWRWTLGGGEKRWIIFRTQTRQNRLDQSGPPSMQRSNRRSKCCDAADEASLSSKLVWAAHNSPQKKRFLYGIYKSGGLN